MMLSVKRIAAFIAASHHEHAKLIRFEAVTETGSTNADLLARVKHLQNPVCLIAQSQTAGRGRAGRQWHTAQEALLFSLAWKLHRSLSELHGLSLAIGVALTEALTVFDIKTELKWPNDVLRHGAKLAGVLIETAQSEPANSASTWAVMGIGLNMVISDSLQSLLGRHIADAPELLVHGREKVLAVLLSALSDALIQFDQHGFAAFAARWNQLHAHTARAVRIVHNGRTVYTGIAVGTDESGRLLIDTADGRRIAILAGDVSLEPMQKLGSHPHANAI